MSSPAIRHLILRFEGVVTQRIDDVLIAELGGWSVDGTRPDADVRMAVRGLVSEVRAGRLRLADCCGQAAELAGSTRSPTRLVTQVLNGLHLTDGMEALIAEVGSVLTPWLYFEIPEPDLAPAIFRLKLDRRVPGSRWLFSSGNAGEDFARRLAARLQERMEARQEELLWVDDRGEVTSAAIRAGVNAVTFVDSRRLRRNLVLRGVLA